MSAVTIVCATLNAREAVQLTFESLARCAREPVEVWVADNGSTDGTLEYLQSLDWLRVFPLAARPGACTDHGSTLDWLTARVQTPYLVTLDSDVEFLARGWLSDMLIFAHDADVDALGVFEPAVGAYRERLAPYVLLLRTAALRMLATSFRSFVRIEDPLEAARWQTRPARENLELAEVETYRTAAFYPTGAAVFEQLRQRGLSWASLPPDLESSFRHIGHMSWADTESGRLRTQHTVRQRYIRARLVNPARS
jgi:glycosyltransferase involved in cell wall biosynthesis